MTFFLVATDALSMHIVIGKDLLQIADVSINKAGVHISKRDDDTIHIEEFGVTVENYSYNIGVMMS